MTSEDEKRLAEIRKSLTTNGLWLRLTQDDCLFLLAKLDESERARTDAEESRARILANCANWQQSCQTWQGRAERAEAALADAENDRSTLTEQHKGYRETIDKLEAALAEEHKTSTILRARFEAADAERAEERAKRELSERNEVVGHRAHRALEQTLRERMSTAEARVAELENDLYQHKMWVEQNLQAALRADTRVKELEAELAEMNELAAEWLPGK